MHDTTAVMRFSQKDEDDDDVLDVDSSMSSSDEVQHKS
jgi:hypothetical protein